jgi:hypothetical protein
LKHLRTLRAVAFLFGITGIFSACRKTHDAIPPQQTDAPFVFSKTFGGDKDDYFYSVTKTPDGGYLATGSTISENGSGDIPAIPAVNGNHDMLIVKTGPDGSRQWVTTIGGDQDDLLRAAVVCPDGSGYMIVGHSLSNGTGDIPAGHGGMEMVVVKLGMDGKKQWIKIFGGNGNDEAHAITVGPTANDYVIAGSTTSDNNGDIPHIHQKLFSFFSEAIVLKLNGNGDLQWIKNYGGNMGEDVRDIVASADGYAIAGYTSSDNNGDIPPTHDGSNGSSDMLILKINLGGTRQWVKTFGGNSFDFATSISVSTDLNGYVIAGMTESNNNGDIPPTKGESDVILIKLDAAGNRQWLKTFGGSGEDIAYSIAPVPGGDYVVTGLTGSNNTGDIPQSHATSISSLDLLAARIRRDGSTQWIRTYGGVGNDQGTDIIYNNDGSYVIAGFTASHSSFDVPANHGSNDGWLFKVKE